MTYYKVAGVITVQGNDRSDMINDKSRVNEVPPRLMVALGIGESDLDEMSKRPQEVWQIDNYWPDVSYGMFHQTVKYAPVGDHTSSLRNCHEVAAWLWEFENALDTAIKYIAPFWKRYQDPLEAMSRYNAPGLSFAENPNQANIQRAWDQSAQYETTEPNTGDLPPSVISEHNFYDVRSEFPYYPGNGEYNSRDIHGIEKIIYHHGASAMPEPTYEAEMAMLHQYEQLHTEKHGWPAIGYHLAVGPSGNIYYLNGLDLVTYHAMAENPSSIGLVWLGNFTDEMPPQNMIVSAIAARLWAAGTCGREDFPYFGHRDFMSTICPGNWWDSGKDALQAMPEEPDTVDDQPALDELRARVDELSKQNSDLINKLGYIQGDLVNIIEQEARKILASKNVGDAKEHIRTGILPALNTLRNL